MNESALFKGTLLLYLFPLLLLFVGAVAGSALAATEEVKEGYSVAGAFIGLVAGFLGLKFLSSKMRLGGQFQPVILSRMADTPVRVVNFEGGLKK